MEEQYTEEYIHDVDSEIMSMVVEDIPIWEFEGDLERAVSKMQEILDYYENQGFFDLYLDATEDGFVLSGDIYAEDYESNPLLNAEGV